MINRLAIALFCWLVTGVAALCVTYPAQAAPPSKFFQAGSVYGTTAAEACTNYKPKNPYGGATALDPNNAASCQLFNANGVPQSNVSIGFVMSCSPVYTAPDTSKPLASQCPDPPNLCKAGELRVQKFVMSSGGGFPTHDMSCNLSVNQMLVCRLEVISGVSKPICMFETKYDGTQYTQNGSAESPKSPGMPLSTPDIPTEPKTSLPPTTVADAQGTCPKGAVQGGVDPSGIPICIGTGTQATATVAPTTTTPVTTTSNADGSTTGTQSTTVTNADGSKTTTTTTTLTAADGSKTVSQVASTSATPTGQAGAADSNKDGLCAQNPGLTICQNSAVNGTCAATTCTGDAIQCATLRAAATIQCTQDQDKKDLLATDSAKLGAQLLAGADPLSASLPSVKNATKVMTPTIDNAGWLGGGSFFKDKTIPIAGYGSVVIPFSQAENVFLVLRAVAVAFGALVSAKILRQSVIGG